MNYTYSLNTFLRVFTALVCYVYATLSFSELGGGRANRYFGFANLAMGSGALLDSIQILILSPRHIILVQELSYIAKEIAVCSLFLFSVHFSTFNRKKNAFSALYLIPLVFFLAAAAKYLFTKNDFFLRLPPARTVNAGFMPGYFYPKRTPYFIHAFYTIGLFGGLTAVFSVRSIKNFSENKRIFLFFFVGMSIFMIPSLHKFVIENFTNRHYSHTQEYFHSFAEICMVSFGFFAIHSNKNQRCVSLCKRSLYESPSQPIFIFNAENKFLHMNASAGDFLDSYRVQIKEFQYFKEIFSDDKFRILGNAESRQAVSAFYVSSVEDGKLYYAKIVKIASNGGTLGSYLSLSNLDFYEGIIKNLEKTAYIDELTGLRKQDSFVRYAANAINRAAEPLLLLCFSIDNLELINGNLGFQSGDEYIRRFALIVQKSLQATVFSAFPPEKPAFELFRIYGSIFSAVIPVSEESKLPVLLNYMKQSCSAYSRRKKLKLTFSAGYSTADHRTQNAWEAFHESYANMLLNRKNKNSGAADDGSKS
ncbi:MAG: diguanylate cyclase domain-containing protein [Treponema sp.]